MKNLATLLILLGCLLAGPTVLDAQLPAEENCCDDLSPKAAKVKADRLYQDLGFKASIPLYEGSVIDLEAMERIANSYRLNHDTENAEKWYAEVVRLSQKPIHVLHYAQALQSNGRLMAAREQYLHYDQLMGGDGQDRRGALLAAAIDRMNRLQHREVELVNVRDINTERLDFSPTYYQEGIVFVSTRGDVDRVVEQKDIWIDDHFMALYYARQREAETMSTPVEFSYQITTKYHEGPVTFSKDGQQIFFTRNNYNRGKRRNSKRGVMKLKIYSSQRSEVGWTEATELPFNTDEYEECHPSLSADGRRLYFASNRPEGEGGMDVYVSVFEGGQWSAPQNLGPEINTSGNEVFPFIHDDGTLYFASDGWGGVGGLDIFSTQRDAQQQWQAARNIGTPFNSPKDDFGFILNVPGNEGYLTSARPGGLGQDDIYHFKMPPPSAEPELREMSAQICAYAADGGQRLSDVEMVIVEEAAEPTGRDEQVAEDYVVKLTPTAQREEFLLSLKRRMPAGAEEQRPERNQYRTDAEGRFEMSLRPGSYYRVVARKSGYQLAEQRFLAESPDWTQGFEWCIPLVAQNCPALEGEVVHREYHNAIPKATVKLTSLCTGEDYEVLSDAQGQFFFPCLPCDCEFVVTGEKVHFERDKKTLSTLQLDCQRAEPLRVQLALGNRFDGLLSDLNKQGQSLEVGTVIELKNIYYDFDQASIRSGAAVDLDRVVALLRAYPSMTLELASHTDARGTEGYNERLSQRRAEAAVAYLVAQGIDARRLVARGYGERMLRNSCRNFVDCSEEEHQYNRRTEIKVLRFEAEEVRVRYLDNGPEKVDRANPKRQFVWE